MVKGRQQANLKNYSGSVANQFGGRNTGMLTGASPIQEAAGSGFFDHHGDRPTGELDFLSKVEQAELRDKHRILNSAAPTPHDLALADPYGQCREHLRMKDRHNRGGFIIGGDSPAATLKTDMYQTTNGTREIHTASKLQGAHEREATNALLEQRGITQAEFIRGGENARAWAKKELGRTQQRPSPSAAAPMRFQRSGMPMLR